MKLENNESLSFINEMTKYNEIEKYIFLSVSQSLLD